MAEPTNSTPSVDDPRPSVERVKMILTELADAAQAAALSVVDQQRARVAAQIGGVAEAVHAAARSLERSRSPAAEYADCGARQIEAVADAIRARHWAGLVADVEDVARRQPTLFVAGAVALGFLAGRFWAALRRTEPLASPVTVAKDQENTVAAAVSSASGNGRLVGWPPPAEPRELP